MPSPTRTRANATITVMEYVPAPFDDKLSPALVEVRVRETFAGDIAGEGHARFLQTLAADGSASFVGVERVTATLARRSGSFVLQDEGTVQGGVVQGRWFVVPGSGTGELGGLRGEGGFEAALGQNARSWLDWWFE